MKTNKRLSPEAAYRVAHAIDYSRNHDGNAVQVFLDVEGMKFLTCFASSFERIEDGCVSVVGDGWHVVGVPTSNS